MNCVAPRDLLEDDLSYMLQLIDTPKRSSDFRFGNARQVEPSTIQEHRLAPAHSDAEDWLCEEYGFRTRLNDVPSGNYIDQPNPYVDNCGMILVYKYEHRETQSF